jgi:long-chain fatty acid transport protein
LPSFAGALAVSEQSDDAVASGGAGMGARAADAATVYFNPAGMTELHRDMAESSLRYFALVVHFRPNAPLVQGGGSGGDAGDKLPLATYFISHPLPGDWAIGTSLTQPFGSGLIYDNGWAGRYYATKNVLKVYDFSVSAAHKLNDWLSIGGGPDIDYATVDYGAAINNVLDRLPDGRINIGINDVALGYNVGLLAKMGNATRIGVTYRSRVQMDLSGKADFENVGRTLRSFGVSGTQVRSKLPLADSAIISIFRALSSDTAMVADAGWMNWSLVKVSRFVFDGGYVSTTPRNWVDTYHAGIALQHAFSDELRGSFGVSYDSSPIRTQDRLPDLPLDRQIRIGAGIGYALNSRLTIESSYEYVDLGSDTIHVTAPANPLELPISGHYGAVAHVVSFSADYEF